MLNANITDGATISRRVNVTMGWGKAVHAGTALIVKGTAYAASPDCGGNRATERYRETTQDVTCKRCLKVLAARAEMLAAAEAEAYFDRSPAAAALRSLAGQVTGAVEEAVHGTQLNAKADLRHGRTSGDFFWSGDLLWRTDDRGRSYECQHYGTWKLMSYLGENGKRGWYLSGPGVDLEVRVGTLLTASAMRAEELISWQTS